MKAFDIRRLLVADPTVVLRGCSIALGLILLVAGLLFVSTHTVFVSHLYSDPHDFVDKLAEAIFDHDAVENVRFDDPSSVGIPNFGYVTDTLYRGAQPKPEGFDSLTRLGVQVVVDLRFEQDQIDAERRRVEGLGMRFVSIPWSAKDNPDDKQVMMFLELLRDNHNEKIFVHCRAGHDRTGVMIALFRIAMQHWTPNQARAEMGVFGFRSGWHHFWHFHLEEYIEQFPKQLATDPNLRPFQEYR